MESVKQGSACIALRSSTHSVIGALKRSVSELSSHQQKILEIDDHLGIGIAGLTADARTLAKWMRNECLNHKYVYGTALPSGRLVTDLADRHQRTTQSYVRRPYGVGLLVASFDKNGPHVYQTCPSGNVYECYATAIGARSQSGRTYLEKYCDSFDECSKDDLIMHALKALVGCVSGDGELAGGKGSGAMGGRSQNCMWVGGEGWMPYWDRLELEGGNNGGNADEEEEDDGEAEEMET
jgi:20S proteasome subunit alpha 6